MPAVEGRVGVLEDDLQRRDVRRGAVGELGRQAAAVDLHRARARLDDSEQRAREGRLAAAGLADEPERLARPEHRRDARERLDVAAVLAEGLREVVDVEERRLAALVGRLLDRDRGRVARERLRALVEVTPALVPATELVVDRLLRVTDLLRERAAVHEDAPREVGPDRRQEARDRVELAAILAKPTAWDAAEQADGVRVTGIVEDLLGLPFLDELARVQHARRCGTPCGSARGCG